MKVVEGPQNHLTTQQEDIIVSSLSSRQGKLYLDATNTEVEVYTPPELRRMFEWAQPETPVAFMDTVNQAALWEFIDSKPAQGSTAEQNKIMQECVQSRAQYIRRFKGHLIRGRS
ncbi:hypothetical protein [Gloeothece citriformis]|nr:hypothetical protein [Gloeothece citriformis]